MFLITHISYNNKLFYVHPVEKFVFSVGTLLVALIMKNISVFLFIIGLMGFLTIIHVGVKMKTLIKLLLIPMFFVIMGITATLIVVNTGHAYSYKLLTLDGLVFGITNESINNSLLLLIQSSSALFSFYFFILSTPYADIEYLMEKFKVPKIIRELVILMYHFIFIFYTITHQVYITQRTRLGYKNIKNSYNSLAQMLASLFVRSFTFSNHSYLALLSRGYNGSLQVMHQKFTYSKKNWIFIILVQIALIIIYFTVNFSIS